MEELLKNPEFMLQVALVALSLLSGVATWVLTRVGKNRSVETEMMYKASIENGIRNVVIAALADGRTDLAEIVELSVRYLSQTKPDALSYVKPTRTGIEGVAKAVLAQQLKKP